MADTVIKGNVLLQYTVWAMLFCVWAGNICSSYELFDFDC